MYLELMKKTLSFMLWPEPPLPVEVFDYLKSPFRRMAHRFIATMLKTGNYQLCKSSRHTTKDREDGRIWPGYADTMIGLKRLDNIQHCVETVIRDGVGGDLIETGVWRGGACIFMRAVLAAYGIADRRVYVADSFEGLPKPDPEKYPADAGDKHHIHMFLAVSQETVENNFLRYGLLDGQVVFLKGWFKDTLPSAPIDKLSVLRLDGDMYGSTIDVLSNLYPKLSKGGFCIIDDYALQGCRRAVDDYRKQHDIHEEIRDVDGSGVYWRKQWDAPRTDMSLLPSAP